MISIKNAEIRKVLQQQSASGCPALTGQAVNGNRTESTMRCEGKGEPACDKCPIRNRIIRIAA